ncbi:MAG TPA: ABC transporter permease subunit [Anaerolineaceae bacterium]|nr:ABC transporter permease subunit [Anaerolineaceae bacterium]HPN52131.1 ABC transporter permease subunit [Anaerolineaceae bacterium]
MNKHIFRHEFLTRLKSVAIWSFSLTLLIAFFFALFPVFADQAALMNEFLSRYPKELRIAFGLDRMDLSTVLGFFSFLFLFVQLCVAIQAGNYGFGLVSIEESELTADFLLSKPVSRSQVMTSKLLAAFASLTVTAGVVWLVTFVSIALFRGEREYDLGTLVMLLFSVTLFQLFFMSVGLCISLLVKRVRSVTPYSLGLGFGCYVMSAFSGIFGQVALELITPFKHFDPAYIIEHNAYDLPLVLLNLGITLAALGVSYWRYIRRDIPAVS